MPWAMCFPILSIIHACGFCCSYAKFHCMCSWRMLASPIIFDAFMRVLHNPVKLETLHSRRPAESSSLEPRPLLGRSVKNMPCQRVPLVQHRCAGPGAIGPQLQEILGASPVSEGQEYNLVTTHAMKPRFWFPRLSWYYWLSTPRS